jgi:hypothetical protein
MKGRIDQTRIHSKATTNQIHIGHCCGMLIEPLAGRWCLIANLSCSCMHLCASCICLQIVKNFAHGSWKCQEWWIPNLNPVVTVKLDHRTTGESSSENESLYGCVSICSQTISEKCKVGEDKKFKFLPFMCLPNASLCATVKSISVFILCWMSPHTLRNKFVSYSTVDFILYCASYNCHWKQQQIVCTWDGVTCNGL